MARGAISKETVTKKILETFQNSFIYDKEIRVPMVEDGTEIQIKITLTAAKTNVEVGGDNAIPGAATAVSGSVDGPSVVSNVSQEIKPTEEEKERVKALMESLNL